jgi:hypothetical protein
VGLRGLESLFGRIDGQIGFDQRGNTARNCV